VADIVLRGRFEIDEQRTCRHLSFDVPEGVDRLHIVVCYNDQVSSDPRLTNGNTLDLGLFDEGGIESGGPGFRGWSGSNKLDLTIGAMWSTPPYRTGKPNAGTWHLLLGAYKIGPRGLDFSAEITFNDGLVARDNVVLPDIGSIRRRPVPPAAVPGWFRGDLHAHTIYSDGVATPLELAVHAVEAGLDFYGITDHNRAQSPIGVAPSGDGWPVLVPGVEVTTYAGHFNVWGTDTWYDFRDPTEAGLQAAVDAALEDCGLVSMNHPKPFGPDWEFPDVTGFHAIEAWNGWWSRLNHVSLRQWDARLVRGERIVGICGSDVHRPDLIGDPDNPFSPVRIGWPTLWVRPDGELSPGTILDAIRAGRCFMSESPAGPQLYLDRTDHEIRARAIGAARNTLVLLGPGGAIHATALAGDDVSVTLPIDEVSDMMTAAAAHYVRAQIQDATGVIRALSNPLWLAAWTTAGAAKS